MNLDHIVDTHLFALYDGYLDSLGFAMDYWSEKYAQRWHPEFKAGYYCYYISKDNHSRKVYMGATLDDVRRFIAKLPPKS